MKHVKVGDIQLGVELRGHQGLPLLLVHGFPLTHEMWQHQIEAFAEHCQVIAPDLRGFGQSHVTEGIVTMEQFADDLNALVDRLEVREKVVFCGLSMGGYIGWEFWRKYKERVRAMILCDTRALPDPPEAAEGRLKLAAQVLAKGADIAVDPMMRAFSEHTKKNNPQVIEQVRKMIADNPPAGIAAALEGMAVRRDARALLPTIDVPTLVIVGEDDVISPVDEMREIADALGNSHWLAVPDAGHLAPLENPAVVNEAISEFLQSLHEAA